MEGVALQERYEMAIQSIIIAGHENYWIVNVVCSRRSEVWRSGSLTPASILSIGILRGHYCTTCRLSPQNTPLTPILSSTDGDSAYKRPVLAVNELRDV